MSTSPQLDNNYNADLMDAMADIYVNSMEDYVSAMNELTEEQQEAMRETEPQEWEGYDDQA